MVLGSQAPRAESSRRYMASSRRRGRRRLPLAIAGLVLACVLAYFFWPSGGSTDAATTGDHDRETVESAGRNPDTANHHTSQDKPAERETAVASHQVTSPRPTPPGAQIVQADPPGHTDRQAKSPPAQPMARDTHGNTAPPVTDQRVKEGMELLAQGKFVAGRAVLSELLFADPPVLGVNDADTIRTTLSDVNRGLIFSKDILPNDPLVEYYTVKSGDRLARIAPHYKIPYQFIELINETPATRIRSGQKLKMINGPLHARVSKQDCRMDLFLEGSDGLAVYVMSVPIGLGENDSTPTGLWKIKQGSKVKDLHVTGAR